MTLINSLDALFTSEVSAQPSNYLINHIAWEPPSEATDWTDLRVIRNTSGYPRNINDGVSIFSEGPESIIITVDTAVSGANSLGAFTYVGGGSVPLSSLENYVYYTNLTASGDTKGAKFNVTRASADFGAVIDVEIISYGSGYAVGDTLTIPKANIGYVSTTATPLATDLVLTVTALGGTQKGITATGFSTTTYDKSKIIPNSGTFTYTNLAGVSVGSSKGKGATFDVSRVGNGTTATTTVTLRNSGSNYKVGDKIRIPAYLIGGRVTETELGMEGSFHIYDTGSSSALTSNPGKGVTGSSLNSPKYYYSLFAEYNDGATRRWKKLGQTSSFAITNAGTVETIRQHLPAIYKLNATGQDNQDLKDFLSLFAFHIDLYRASNKAVFEMSNPKTVDEPLLKLLIKQFGGSYENVSSLIQARTLLTNLIRNYLTSGSSIGVANQLESHSGYPVSIQAGTNYLHNYNTSSFVETVGDWYPRNSDAYSTSAPYLSVLTLAGPVDESLASYANWNLTLATASSVGKTITLSGVDTSKIRSGMRVQVSSGTGEFAVGTVVTYVESSTTFKVNLTPGTPLDEATIQFSDNIISGMGKVTAEASGSPLFSTGPKRAELTATASSGATSLSLKPNIAATNDYILLPAGNSSTSIIEGTYVTSATSSSHTVSISNKTGGAIASAQSVWLSPPPASDIPAASTAWQAVQPSKPYAFSMYFSKGGGTARTTEVKISWYNVKGESVGTTATGTLASATQSNANDWYLNHITAVSPVNAAYAEPAFAINSMDSDESYYVDASSFTHPIQITYRSLTDDFVTLSTSEENNFVVNRTVSVTGLGAPFDGTFPITAVTNNASTGNYSFTYAATNANIIGDICLGYAASIPTNFVDARTSEITVASNRTNLVPNPSFETNITGWAASTSAVAVSRITSDFYKGSASLQAVIDAGTAANSGVVSNSSTYPVKVSSGEYYTFSGYIKVTTGASATYDIHVVWYDSSEGSPSTVGDPITGTATTVALSSGWVRLSVGGEAPSGAYRAAIHFRKKSAMTNTATFLVDAVLTEKSEFLDYYFDGDYDGQNYSDDRDSMWEATDRLSPSHLYIDRVTTLGKLDSLITDVTYYA
jgi:hypothetical protein